MFESIYGAVGGGVYGLVWLPCIKCISGCLLKNPAVASAVAVYTIHRRTGEKQGTGSRSTPKRRRGCRNH